MSLPATAEVLVAAWYENSNQFSSSPTSPSISVQHLTQHGRTGAAVTNSPVRRVSNIKIILINAFRINNVAAAAAATAQSVPQKVGK